MNLGLALQQANNCRSGLIEIYDCRDDLSAGMIVRPYQGRILRQAPSEQRKGGLGQF
jgi:hypothetical protein